MEDRQFDLKGKRSINDLLKHPKDIKLENSLPIGKVRDGYYSLDEFTKIAIEKGLKFCDEHGII